MTKGQVKWFDPKKGYGFLVGPEGQDVFIHYSHIQSEGFKALRDGEWVEYELLEGEKGWQARNVQQSADEEAAGATPPPPRPAKARPPAEKPVVDDVRPAGYEGAGGETAPEPPLSRGYEGADD